MSATVQARDLAVDLGNAFVAQRNTNYVEFSGDGNDLSVVIDGDFDLVEAAKFLLQAGWGKK